MATKTYGTSVLPSDTVTVRSGGTVAVSIGFNSSVGFVGGMDTANGSATPGDVHYVSSVSEAKTLFGDGSELHRATQVAYSNGVAEVYAVAVPETTVTQSFAGTASGTLSNTPAFDPNVNEEHSITAQDTLNGASVTVNIVYDLDPTAPSDANTINLNPVNGNWRGDESTDYDITYDYGDYTAQQVSDLLDKSVRFVAPLTEAESVVNTALSEVNSRAQNFEFSRVVGGIMPEVAPADHSDGVADQRAVLNAASRAYLDRSKSEEVRTAAAVAGALAASPLGDSTTGTNRGAVSGLAKLRTEYTNSELGDFVDKQVLPVKQGASVHIAKDMTTSQDARFERVYAVEIVDEVTELSHLVSEQFVGALNFEENRNALRDSHVAFLEDMAGDRPPLLNDPEGGAPYAVNVSTGASQNEVDVEVGIDVVDVMDRINVTITVGDVIENEGAA